MAAQTTLAGIDFLLKAVVVVAEIGFCQCGIELAVVLLHEGLAGNMASVHGTRHVLRIEPWSVVTQNQRIGGEVRRDEISVFLNRQRRMPETEFQIRDL